jgi:hypothetical protein
MRELASHERGMDATGFGSCRDIENIQEITMSAVRQNLEKVDYVLAGGAVRRGAAPASSSMSGNAEGNRTELRNQLATRYRQNNRTRAMGIREIKI